MQKHLSGSKKKTWIRSTLIFLGVILLVGIGAGILVHIILTPEKVTPIVLNLANEHIDADVKCESIEITFFKTFPHLGVHLKNGSIVNRPEKTEDTTFIHLNSPQDTLIGFRDCTVSFNPITLLFDKKISVNRIEINHPVIYAFVNQEGKANWEIFSESSSEQDTTRATSLPELNLNQLQITDAIVVYDDRVQDLFISVDSVQLKLKGNMSARSADLDLKLDLKSLTTYSEGRALIKGLPLGMNARLKNDKTEHRLTIEKALLSAGTLKFDVSGTLQKDSTHLPAQADLNFKLQASSLSDLLEMVPSHILEMDKNLITSGSIDSQGSLKGNLGKDVYPLLTLSFHLENGSLRSAKYPQKSGIKKADIDCEALVDMNGQTPSYIRINKIILESASSSFECSGTFDNLFTKPHIEMAVDGNINFDRMSQDFSFAQDMKAGGFIRLNLSGNCFLNDILALDYGKIDINGNVDINNVIVNYPKEDINFFASAANLRLGSNVKDSIRGQERESLLRGNLEIDSLNLNWKKELSANASKLFSRFRTDNLTDTTQIARMSTSVRFENLRFTMGDSIRLRISKANGSLRTAPMEGNPKRPEISLRFTVDSLRTRTPVLGGGISNAKLTAQIKPLEIRSGRMAGTRSDSTAWAGRRDSLRTQDQNANLSFRLESNEVRDILRKWDINGSFECNNMNLRTPYFPLPLRMIRSSLGFTANSLSLENVQLKAGSSDMVLSGEIEGIRQALLRNGKVTAKLNLVADSLDFNQLIRTAAAGAEYSDKNSMERDSISQAVLDDTLSLAIHTDTTATGVFVIPRNLDLEFNSTIKNAKYNQLNLKNTSGKIIIRDQSVRLPDFHLHSDVGDARVSLVYKAENIKGAYVGLDVQMKQIYIKELIDAFPMIDTLTPMLKSFEGVVDCNMAAVTELDSAMNVIMPKTTASCYLSGVNMVLLDGETFAEISKMLMFKNKKRNMIDAIAAEMILENGKILVFPFQVTLDRYTAGVGGTQNLDLSFNYHISVLKSPIPFKIGINLSGTPDKMKIRLAKPKYSDLFTPAKVQSLETTQTNLRQQLHESLKKSIDAIIQAPASSPIRRPQVQLNDSLNNLYFKMDTTTVNYPLAEGKETLQTVSDSISSEP